MTRGGLEDVGMSSDESPYRHRRLACHATNDVVRPGEESVLMVLRHAAQMLNQEGRHSTRALEALPVSLHCDRLIPYRVADHFTDSLGDAGLIHFDRPKQRIQFAAVRRGIAQHSGDKAGLVLGRDRRVAPLPARRTKSASKSCPRYPDAH
jgi:hypothetical protein